MLLAEVVSERYISISSHSSAVAYARDVLSISFLGVEGRVPKKHVSLRDERNVESSYNCQAISDLSNEREKTSLQITASIPSEYQFRIPGQREPISGQRLADRW